LLMPDPCPSLLCADSQIRPALCAESAGGVSAERRRRHAAREPFDADFHRQR
jgi:hypothetical protein